MNGLKLLGIDMKADMKRSYSSSHNQLGKP